VSLEFQSTYVSDKCMENLGVERKSEGEGEWTRDHTCSMLPRFTSISRSLSLSSRPTSIKTMKKKESKRNILARKKKKNPSSQYLLLDSGDDSLEAFAGDIHHLSWRRRACGR
jgi:hypothetical protein